MKRLVLAISVIALLLLGTSMASAETVPLGSAQETSRYPSAFIAPDTLQRAESFVVTVVAEPIQSLQFQDYTSCTRGSETIAVQGTSVTITPPFSTTIMPTLSEPDSCWIDASAEAPFSKAVTGMVEIEVTGNRRPAPLPTPESTPVGVDPMPEPTWVRCAAPAFLKSGRTESHGGRCAEAQKVATKAWHKPLKQGKEVKVGRFYCRRSQLGNEVTIHCASNTKIVKVNGRLR